MMSSLGKLHPICCHSLNEFICLCIGHWAHLSLLLPPLPLSLPPSSPPALTGVPLGTLYIPGTTPGTYCSTKQTCRQMPCTAACRRVQRAGRRETSSRCNQTGSPGSSSAPLLPLRSHPARLLPVRLLTSPSRSGGGGGSDVLTPCCCCWYHCCSRDSAACWEPRQDGRSTGCPRVHSKVGLHFLLTCVYSQCELICQEHCE